MLSFEIDGVASGVRVLLELEVISRQSKWIQNGIPQLLQLTCMQATSERHNNRGKEGENRAAGVPNISALSFSCCSLIFSGKYYTCIYIVYNNIILLNCM